ncbi:putative Nodulation-signaling pathway 1 protein [Melia azedarach]|uniref:Nodulation-signaling pathway 1 protein n=1 Tax=Melia azedarach TaxID=155640 RepID=A0ACC1Y453_MELAZ|nr:putative Nodulation-signaling pathway 1 protein [Melia azedarach]
MTIEEPEPNPTTDHLLDWLEDSVSFLPSFLDDPYNANEIDAYQWWNQGQDLAQEHLINTAATPLNNTNSTVNISTTTSLIPAADSTAPSHPTPSDSTRKRRNTDDSIQRSSQNHQQRRNQGRRIGETDEGNEEGVTVKKSAGNKKNTNKNTGSNSNNGNNKEGRWAEQLLNPCAAAITAGNLTRVQHLLYVLHELASPTGDANHRLAAHGLRALTHHLSSLSSSSSTSTSIGPVTFASTEPRFFQKSLLNFYDKSPWFAFPNNIANSSILQILAQDQEDHARNLHILDIGVSHGVQWPTLLEALTRRAGGPPPLVRLTIIAPTAHLNGQIIGTASEETLIVCAQFRLHHLNHNTPDERTEFLRVLRSLEPKGLILSENNMDCSCSNCGDFATGFALRVEYLWRFLDSTSAAFKGRESEERRVMEGEAAKALTNKGEMNEGKEKWRERMRGIGFVGEIFGEDAIDGGRALLRKYDSNWEMRVEEKDGCIGLWWKGQPVSFCSLWKLNVKLEDS